MRAYFVFSLIRIFHHLLPSFPLSHFILSHIGGFCKAYRLTLVFRQKAFFVSPQIHRSFFLFRNHYTSSSGLFITTVCPSACLPVCLYVCLSVGCSAASHISSPDPS